PPDQKRDALANIALDLLGNGVELREWDDLRRLEKSGRVAGASVIKELYAASNSTVGEFVDKFAAATSYRAPYALAIAQGSSAVELRGASGRRAAIPNDAASGWIRDLPFADVSQFGSSAQIAICGRWTED